MTYKNFIHYMYYYFTNTQYLWDVLSHFSSTQCLYLQNVSRVLSVLETFIHKMQCCILAIFKAFICETYCHVLAMLKTFIFEMYHCILAILETVIHCLYRPVSTIYFSRDAIINLSKIILTNSNLLTNIFIFHSA